MSQETPYSFLLLTEPRSGTHFLLDVLHQACPAYTLVSRYFDNIDYLHSEEFNAPVIIHGHYTLLKTVLDDLECPEDSDLISHLTERMPGFKFVYLSRSNRIRQAISSTLQGKSGEKVIYEPVEEEKKKFEGLGVQPIVDKVVDLAQWQIMSEDFFAEHNIRPYRVVYEDLVGPHSLSVLQALFDFLGIEASAQDIEPRSYKMSGKFTENLYNRVTNYWKALRGIE